MVNQKLEPILKDGHWFDPSAGAAATTRRSIGMGAQGSYSGLDQYNILIPSSLAGKGQVDVVVTAGGKPSNPAILTIQ